MLITPGARGAEAVRIKVSDVDSPRIVVHIRLGKGGHERDVLLNEKLLNGKRAAMPEADILRNPPEHASILDSAIRLLLTRGFLGFMWRVTYK